jgi:hypothetical protein
MTIATRRATERFAVAVLRRRVGAIMEDHAPRTAGRTLRGAAHTGEGTTIVRVLREHGGVPDQLQLAGDALLVALRQGATGAADVAEAHAEALDARSWEGDAEVAADLRAAAGSGPVPLLRTVPIDLEQLAVLVGLSHRRHAR